MEKWDLYDKNLQLNDKTIDSEKYFEIPDGLYHLTVNVWLISNNKVLMLKKNFNYNLRYPGCWTSLNGNVISGESSIDAVSRILKKKIGINTDNIVVKELGIKIRDPHHYIFNTFAVYIKNDLKLSLDNKVYSNAKWIDKEELNNMIENGEVEWVLIDRINEYIMKLL